jgi:redox-regulated HSP33 family molecular chaperone
MDRQVLKDKHNNTIGYIVTDSTGKQTIRDKNNNTKGYYDPKTNVTKDRHNNTVGKGNLLTTLL